MVAATVMTMASNSSTPLLAYLSGVFGLCMWPLRDAMRLIRWGIVLSLVFLHMIMKAPVWHLISRIDIAGGSSSYHRYALVDNCIRHFGDWWLLGVKYNGQWGWDMWDTANQYVALAQSSGLFPFVLFIIDYCVHFPIPGESKAGPDEQPQASTPVMGDRRCLICPGSWILRHHLLRSVTDRVVCTAGPHSDCREDSVRRSGPRVTTTGSGGEAYPLDPGVRVTCLFIESSHCEYSLVTITTYGAVNYMRQLELCRLSARVPTEHISMDSHNIAFEVIVVDNASPSGDVDVLKREIPSRLH